MKFSLKVVFSAVLVSVIFISASKAQEKLTKYADPRIGTNAHGHTYPGAVVPFGMVQLSLDTDIDGWDWCSGYHYSDSSIMGFSHTHLSGTGCTDLGDILFMATTGVLKTEPGQKNVPGSGYRSRFSHSNEIATPGYYSVLLEDYNIKAELTAGLRTGFQKYTFPKSNSAHILVDLEHGIQDKVKASFIEVVNNKTIRGYRTSVGWGGVHTVYFAAEFSKPFLKAGIVNDGINIENETKCLGKKLKAYFNFNTSEKEVILVKTGISFVDIEGASKNLSSEIPGWDFAKLKNNAERAWQNQLSKIKIETENLSKKKIFYSALYHSLLNPNVFSDADGRYFGMDKKIHKSEKGKIYTVFSLWDTFRAEQPLFTLLDKERVSEMVNSLITRYKESGLLPVWELNGYETNQMVGYHSVPVIVDAYLKGIRGFDIEKTYEAIKQSAMQDGHGVNYYRDMGFINCDLENEGVSKTLEYAYDDWCIAMMAKALSKEADYSYYLNRSKYYSNMFDSETSLMRPKKNGKWISPFDPNAVGGYYTEANAWQYSFFAPHDISGLTQLMNGEKNFIAKLDEMFNESKGLSGKFQPDVTGLIGQYAHGNEPSHHMVYLYNYLGKPDKTQEKIHEIVTKLYTEKPDGLCGNDDCGQMSAWFVFSSIGFYPVCPGDNKYVIGTPSYKSAVLKTAEGKVFKMTAKNLSDKNIYIQSAKLNGREYPYSYIEHHQIASGGELVFEMGPEPGEWGTGQKYRPRSSVDTRFLTVPFLTSGERVFKETTVVSLASSDKSVEIFYSSDKSSPTDCKNKYSGPLTFNKTTTLKAVCKKDGVFSNVITACFNKMPEKMSVKLNTNYNSNYTGGGAEGLIDGVRGTSNFHTDPWQGYEGDNLDAVVDLGSPRPVKSIAVTFLQNTGSWIFYPVEVEYFVSDDGKDFRKVFGESNPADEKNSDAGIKEFKTSPENVSARYIRVKAKNAGICPDWHKGAGYKAWLFVDEISIK